MPSLPISPDTGPQVLVDLIYSLKVRDAMTSPVITAAPGDSLRSIQYLMKDNSISGVPIVEGKRLVGLISVGDIIQALDDGKIDEPASSRMIRTIISLEDDMPLSFAITYFDRYKYGRFPVMDRTGCLAGVVTAADIVRCLLVALNAEVARLEEKLASRPAPGAEAADAGSGGGHRMVSLSFPVTRLDFEHAGTVSSAFKKAVKELGVEAATVRRVAVACYELELNLVIHSVGGSLSLRAGSGRIEIEAADRGPGIPDVEAAMREGFSTATEWIRSLGFGAGMGLPNVKRVSDEFFIQSSPEQGTRVRVAILYKEPA
jgi:CBS domain-containing protein/anti-sigma regulatory factor (Ser/Thr protein kinase)